jgi:hypothetical protein
LLAEVYAELVGGRQARLVLIEEVTQVAMVTRAVRPRAVPLSSLLSDEERVAHLGCISSLGPQAIWNEYAPVVLEASAPAADRMA